MKLTNYISIAIASFFTMFISAINAQDSTMVKLDSSKCEMSKNKFSNILSFHGRYYFSPNMDTRTLLNSNGFVLDKEAFEIQARLYNLPKVFFFQQLGTLQNGNYTTIQGLGIKEDLRWNILHSEYIFIVPYVEFGAGYYRMDISKGINSNSLTSVFNGNIDTKYVDNFVFSGDIGLDLGFAFDIDKRRLHILFNGGYLTNLPSEWKLAGSLAFKEKVNLGSPYAGASIKIDINKMNCCQ